MNETAHKESARPVVALYIRYYLSPSETFVYRQLQGIAKAYRPIVLTANLSHRDLFPFEPIHVQGKSFLDKVVTRVARNVSGRHTVISRRQYHTWKQILRDERVTLIHAHFAHFALDLLPLARELAIPMVVTMHGFDASILLGDNRYVRDLRALAEYATIIAVSHNMVERLAAAGVRPPRLHVHYIGVPVGDFHFVEREPIGRKLERGEGIRLLQVSNLVEVKGHRYTIEAFARYLATHPASTLTLAGEGPLRPAIEQLCREKGIEASVRMVGRVTKERVVELMTESDAFVQHSVTLSDGCKEGLPTVIMEAMATGLPVVSTRHSGIPELVEDGVTGFLVEERDVEGYAGALEALAGADPELPRRARRKVETAFNMAQQNLKLIEIYDTARRG